MYLYSPLPLKRMSWVVASQLQASCIHSWVYYRLQIQYSATFISCKDTYIFRTPTGLKVQKKKTSFWRWSKSPQARCQTLLSPPPFNMYHAFIAGFTLKICKIIVGMCTHLIPPPSLEYVLLLLLASKNDENFIASQSQASCRMLWCMCTHLIPPPSLLRICTMLWMQAACDWLAMKYLSFLEARGRKSTYSREGGGD